jgi:ribose transport system permease protein
LGGIGDSWIVFVLLGLVIGFGVLRSEFWAPFNLLNILVAAALLAIMAVGQTYVIITAGIDLSVGSVLVFSGVVAAVAMEDLGGQSADWPVVFIGLLVALAGGLLWGAINGFLVSRTRIPPLIVTLGTLSMAMGAALVIAGGVDLYRVPVVMVDAIGFGVLIGIPIMVIVAGLVLLAGHIHLSMTKFGRTTYAVGSNIEAAKRAGINVRSHLFRVYLLQGGLAGLAGFLSLARFNSTTVSGHAADNLAVISGVVLGGTSLFGGSGWMIGTAVGILIPAVLRSGLIIVGVQPFYQTIAIGAILILAVFIDQLKRERRRAM